MSLLSMQGICKSFGNLQANHNVDLEVARGEIHALLGENGAGKTTLMNILYGLYQADEGTISINDRKASITSPKDAIALRIGMVHQHFMLVPTLSVSQNITLGIKEKGYPFTKRQSVNQKITDLSEKYGLNINPDDIVEDLSVGVLQRVEIIKLLYHEAELLILDEPTAVLTPQETENLFLVLEQLKSAGRSVIIITHRIAEVLTIADKVTVLRDGILVGSMDIQDTDSTRLSELMIGRRLKEDHPQPCSQPGLRADQDLLSLLHVTLIGEGKNILNDLSMKISPGEIFGLAGVDGNGQKELAEVIIGIRTPELGSVIFQGDNVTNQGVQKRKRMGMAYIPDDRHQDGLVLDMDITSNLILNNRNQAPFARFCFLQNKVKERHAKQMIADYQIKTSGAETEVRYLSGGNQQKIVLARELDGTPKLIVACQPTRGLDIGAEEFINNILLAQREKGVGVLLISANLDQLLKLSDRIAVIFEGQITGLLTNDGNISAADIGLKMAGMTSGEK